MFRIFVILLFFTIPAISQRLEIIESFIGYQEDSEIITFTPNNQILFSGDYTGNINLWDLEKQMLIKTIQAHNSTINSIKFSEKGNLFTTCSNDSIVKIWHFNSNKLIDSTKTNSIPKISIFNKENDGVLIFTENGEILEKKLNSKYTKKKFTKNNAFLDAVLSEDKKSIIACDQKSLKIINYISGESESEILNPNQNLFSKIEIYSNDTIITWSNDGTINFFKPNKKETLLEFRSKNPHNKLSINKHCDIVISGFYKDRAFLINMKEIDFSEEYNREFIITNTFLSSLNNKYLVSSGENRKHRLMEIKDHQFFPVSIQKRKIADHKKFEINSRFVILEIWDNAQVDGDTISLYFNGEWILKNHGLVKGRERKFLRLEEGKENTVIFFAENIGRIPPNTTSIKLIDGFGNNKIFEINSNLDENGAITLIQKGRIVSR
tara:strand:+ start:312 stop:1622 length:1311 start_codon:yes stop_codon:yes gene_type:complete